MRYVTDTQRRKVWIKRYLAKLLGITPHHTWFLFGPFYQEEKVRAYLEKYGFNVELRKPGRPRKTPP